MAGPSMWNTSTLMVSASAIHWDLVIPAEALHLHQVQAFIRDPVDIALVCTKSYDTAWNTRMIQPYLRASGCVVSVQNSINEDEIAAIVGADRTMGCIASTMSVSATGLRCGVAAGYTRRRQPYSVDRGFTAGENVVTVQSVVAISAPAYSQSEHAQEHAALLADVIGERACGYWTAIGMCYANWHPLILLGPSIAKVFAQDGWSKDDIRQYFYDKVKIKASTAERYAYGAGLTGFRIANAVKDGLLPQEYHLSDDPQRLVPVFQRPQWMGIVVAGDAGRNQS